MLDIKCPQVLLFGNGVNRAYECNSWNDLINEIAAGDPCESELPMPLRIVLATHNQVDNQLGKYLSGKTSKLDGNVSDPRMRKTLQRILSMGFSDILTTNYSYELEIAASGRENISKWQMKEGRTHTKTVRRAEGKYYLHTYQEVSYKQIENRI